MGGWPVIAVTGQAVCCACELMIEVSWTPGSCRVTGGTLSSEMVGRLIGAMTTRTINCVGRRVVKIDF